MIKIKSIFFITGILLLSTGAMMAQVTEKDYKVIDYPTTIEKGEPLEKALLFKGEKRIIAQVTLREGKSLGMHTEHIPFLVYAISGKGELILGENEKIIVLKAGTLVTVESGIAHDVVAKPELSILVIKLTGDQGSNEKHDHK